MNDPSESTRKWFYTNWFKYVVSVFSLLLLVAVISINIITVDKVIIEPGTAELVEGKIDFGKTQTYDSEGDIKFLTVFVSSRKPSVAAYLKARYFDDDAEIFPWKEINGDQSPEENDELNNALMSQSQNAASVVALNEIGCEVLEEGTGAIVSQIQKKSPASKELEIGDVIVQIDGNKIDTSEQAVNEITSRDPGDALSIVVERGGKSELKTFNVTLAKSPFKEGAAFLGVGLLTRDQDFDFPVNIKIDPGAVSGPSAGLAFTLSIIDQLTKGDLTGGIDVAVTGEIALDGQVNPVGGVKQKAIAAKRAGSKIMIVPKGEGSIARETSGAMKVFEVDSIDGALKVLRENGGDEIRQVQSCPSS